MLTFEYFRRRTLLLRQRFGWRLVGLNNEIVASSGPEGFSRREDAERNAKLTFHGLADAIDSGAINSTVVK